MTDLMEEFHQVSALFFSPIFLQTYSALFATPFANSFVLQIDLTHVPA